MKTLIVGRGQIGSALGEVLKDYKPIFLDFQLDLHLYAGEYISKNPIDVLHVCFEYSDEFVQSVKNYQKIFKPKHTVIHSTVPVGISAKCGAIHSPVIGIHPHLESGIRTFVKFLGGKNASGIADYFRRAGVKVYLCDKPETTELMKVLDTTFYGLCIEYTKEVKRLCDKYQVPFEAWTLWTDNYNSGYAKLGHPEFTRPNLVPIERKIGGHCVLPNAELLDSDFARFLKDRNKKDKGAKKTTG